MITIRRLAPLFAVVFLVAGCATQAPRVSSATESAALRATARTPEQDRIILWWSGYAGEVRNITHVVNDVWVGSAEDNPDASPEQHQDAWLARNIVPLDWAGGRVYADQGVEGLADRWSGAIDSGYFGIAIDEFGSPDDETDRILHEALLRFREAHPDTPVFIWHGGLVDDEAARVYREAATAVILEVYVSGSAFLNVSMGFRLRNVRRHGLEGKTIVAISIGEDRFADSEEEVRAQVRWILENAQDFAGIGFYASRASEELVRAADESLTQLMHSDPR